MSPLRIDDGTSQPLTTAGAVAPSTGLDISALSGDYEISVTVIDLHGADDAAHPPKARIVIEDSVNAFTAALPVALLNIQGPISKAAPVTFSWKSDRAPSMRLGVTSAVLRANVVKLDGTSPSITLQANLLN